MKRYLLLLISFVTILGSHAQTQQGYVKTKGRLTANGTVIHGERLNGATISLTNRNVVTKGKGDFSFPTSGKSFYVKNIQKNGYQLYDRDQLKTYSYSANPLVLVLEKPEDYEQDKLQKQQQISRTLRRQLAKREDEIERLKEQNKISEEEYNRLYNELYTNEKKNQDLIEDMAKRYALMDFDRMDETNLKIKTFILNGELERADSVINSKGSIEERKNAYLKLKEANKQEEENIAKRQENLDKSKEFAKKALLDLAEDCMNKFEVCKLQNKHDSAAYYIEERAGLDTLNAEWQFDAGDYFFVQNEYTKSEKHWLYALTTLETAPNSQLNKMNQATAKMNLGSVYWAAKNLTECETMYKAALELYRQLAKENPTTDESGLAKIQFNLGTLYADTQRFTESENMYKAALEIQKRLAKENPIKYESDFATIQMGLGNLYYTTQKFSECEELYKAALEINLQLAQKDPKADKSNLADIQINLGALYRVTQRLDESETMYKAALNTLQQLAKDNPKPYAPKLAILLRGLGDLYLETKKNTKCETMYKAALEILQNLIRDNPKMYEVNLEDIQMKLGKLYYTTHRLTECEIMYKGVLEIRKRQAKNNSNSNMPSLVEIQMKLGLLYRDMQKIQESETMYTAAFDALQQLNKDYPRIYESELTTVRLNLGIIYFSSKRLAEAENMFKAVLETCQLQQKDSTLKYVTIKAFSCLYLSEIYIQAYKYQETFKTSTESMPIWLEFYKEGAITKEQYTQCLTNLAFAANVIGKFHEGEKYSKESLAVDSTEHLAYTNLAASLLMQGRYSEAEKLYIQFKSEFKDSFLDDLKVLTEYGVIPKEREADVEKIKRLLTE